jgi:hypothetical protein
LSVIEMFELGPEVEVTKLILEEGNDKFEHVLSVLNECSIDKVVCWREKAKGPRTQCPGPLRRVVLPGGRRSSSGRPQTARRLKSA